MKINRNGISRIVLELDTVVIKLPNPSYSWCYFLTGILSNIQESNTYKFNSRKDLLAPVLWCSWGGWILVMQKADVSRHIKEVEDGRLFSYSKFINAGIKGDEKCDNFGYIDDKLVKIDYGV